MKLIQISGANGTGKTTLVKNLLVSGNFMKMHVVVNGVKREWWYDGSTAVVGVYNSNKCCGVDRYACRDYELIQVIVAVAEQAKPKTIVFEEVRLGTSYAFRGRLRKAIEEIGGKYSTMALYASYETLSRRVIERNGNGDVQTEKIRDKARAIIKACKRIKADGDEVIFVDTEKNDTQKLLAILRRMIDD